MSLYYLDTSALVKLYVREPGTDHMIHLVTPSSGHTFAVLALTRLEFRAAVRQRERRGNVAHTGAESAITKMEEHFQRFYLVQLVTESVIEEAAALLDRHALRTYDAVQLAGCLTLRAHGGESVSFVCSDRQLLFAAQHEGLAVFDPVAEPPA